MPSKLLAMIKKLRGKRVKAKVNGQIIEFTVLTDKERNKDELRSIRH